MSTPTPAGTRGPGPGDRVVLAYSGGLDTSVAVGWISEATGAEVVAVAVDVGQGGEDMEVIRQRALGCGAVESHVVDAAEEFARDYVWPSLQANALYMDRYPLVSSLSRPLIGQPPGARGAGDGGDGGGARLHRQGERPGAVRGEHGRAGARPHGAGARARLRHGPGLRHRLRRAARAPGGRDQAVAVLHRPEPLGAAPRSAASWRTPGRRLRRTSSSTRPTRRWPGSPTR